MNESFMDFLRATATHGLEALPHCPALACDDGPSGVTQQNRGQMNKVLPSHGKQVKAGGEACHYTLRLSSEPVQQLDSYWHIAA